MQFSIIITFLRHTLSIFVSFAPMRYVLRHYTLQYMTGLLLNVNLTDCSLVGVPTLEYKSWR